MQGAKARIADLATGSTTNALGKLATAKDNAATALANFRKGQDTAGKAIASGEGLKTGAAFTAYDAWLAAAATLEAKRVLYQKALDEYKIGTVVTKVSTLETAVDTAKKALDAYVVANVSKAKTGLTAVQTAAEADLKLKQAAYDKAQQACRSAAFKDYQAALAAALKKRGEDLDAIKKLIAANKAAEPAAGAVGSRCEKALSNGTFRPARTEVDCGGEGTCCGAARVWMDSGSTADAGWRTIETCGTTEQATYDYQPPRAPMATTMPATLSVPFTCIEGAKKLAAAASAVAAAVYMLA